MPPKKDNHLVREEKEIMYKNAGRFLGENPRVREGLAEVARTTSPHDAFSIIWFYPTKTRYRKPTIRRSVESFTSMRSAKKRYDGLKLGYRILVKGLDIVQQDGDKSIVGEWALIHVGADPMDLKTPREQVARSRDQKIVR